MEIKDQSERKYYIYQQVTQSFIEVSQLVYLEFYRFTKRERDVLRKEGKCECPRSFICYCDCDCDICPYRTQPIIVQKKPDKYDTDEIESEIPDTAVIADELKYRQLRAAVDKISEVYPEARRIIMLRYQGLTDSEIERVIGIGRHTFQNRLKKALQKLGFNAEDFH